MRLTTRELILAWITAVAILFTATWFVLAPRIESWKTLREREREVAGRIEVDTRLIQQSGYWSEALAGILRTLPVYPLERDVTADLLIRIETLAAQSGLTLERREAQKEERQGELFSLSINCRWEASLDSLVRFLFALQSDSAILDVSQLSITPDSQRRLKGGFTVDGAYSRTAAAAERSESASPPEQP